MDGNTVQIWRLRRRILSQLFDLLYSFGNVIYDPLTVFFFGRAWHNWRRTVLQFVGRGPVLDLACGTGKLLPDLAERASTVIGVDRSPPMLSRARRCLESEQVHLVLADATNLPFSASTFETVVSTFPAGFVADRDVLDQVATILVPGGRYVVVASARFTRFQWTRPFIHLVLRLAYGSSDSMNRWPDDLLSHPALPGQWHDLRTPEGEAFVWVATKAAKTLTRGGD